MPVPQIQGLMSRARAQAEVTTEPQKVFVYGTLKKGYPNHDHHLTGARYVGAGTIEGLMFHLGGFPAINLSERFTEIMGEVYETDWDHMIGMDRLEGVGSGFYERIKADIKPFGAAWTYVFSHSRAAREEWLIPSGNWSGRETPKVKWGGFGKGVEIGAFETRLTENEIRIGAGESDYVLRRNGLDSSYKLINKKTGEVLGSYTHLRDMTGADGRKKPVLRLPAISKPTDSTVSLVVRENLKVIPPNPLQQHPSLPIIWTPPDVKTEIKEEEEIPQAARLLGVKYGEA